MADEQLTAEKMTEIALSMNAMAELYGLVSATDAFAIYKDWYGEGVSLEEFAGTVWSAAQSGRFAFRIWEASDCDYIVHSTLSDETEHFTIGDAHHYSMAEYRLHLLEQQSIIPRKRFSNEPATKGVLNWKMEQEPVRQLEAQLMLGVPEDVDARFFAQQIIRELLCVSLVAYDQAAAAKLLTMHGMIRHNRLEDPTMPMIARTMDTVPCWEYCGWSPAEHRNGQDGSGSMGFTAPISAQDKVGRNDPCPCGSGKKYKNCCGASKED